MNSTAFKKKRLAIMNRAAMVIHEAADLTGDGSLIEPLPYPNHRATADTHHGWARQLAQEAALVDAIEALTAVLEEVTPRAREKAVKAVMATREGTTQPKRAVSHA